MHVRVHLLAGLAFLVGCRSAQPDTPEDAYRAFAAAANKGEDAAAFARLSSQTQTAMKQVLGDLSIASGGSLKQDTAALVFGGARGAPLASVRVLRMQPGEATVSVTARDQTREVTLKREGNEWRIELPVGPP